MIKKLFTSLSLFVIVFSAARAQDNNNMSTEQMLLELQKQMTTIQTKLDEIQVVLSDSTKMAKDIIPSSNEKNKSKFYWSLRCSFLYSNDQYIDNVGSKEKVGVKVSYALKPAFGYIFSPRLSVGCTVVFADCRFSDVSASTFQYMLANAMIGGGVVMADYITWSLQPYVRYKLTKVIWDKLNLWGEFSIYAGQRIMRDPETHELQTWNTSTIYGAQIRPMLTLDLNKDMMLFSSMHLLSWNGSCRTLNGETLVNNSFAFEIVPIYSILSGLFNIGIIRKF